MFKKTKEIEVPRKKFDLGEGVVGKAKDLEDFKQIIQSLKNLGAKMFLEEDLLELMQENSESYSRGYGIPCHGSYFSLMRSEESDDDMDIDLANVRITQEIRNLQKYLALDFMGTMNNPKAKEMIWENIKNDLVTGDIKALREAGLTKEQIRAFEDYIGKSNCSPMQLRDYVLDQKGIKAAIGRYNSIAAEEGQLDFCKITQDAVDFLALVNILDHKVEIFSTVGAPEGYKSTQQLLLEQQKLSPGYSMLTGKETAFDLVTGGITVSKLKKSKPGQAVLEETKNKGLDFYVDDDREVIDAVVETFSSQEDSAERQNLPILCRIEREGVKKPGYNTEKPAEIGEIVVAKTLMDNNLLSKLFKNAR